MQFFKVLFLSLLFLALLQAQQSKVKDIKRAKLEQAALLAVEQSISSLQARQRKEGQLAEMILDDTSAHASPGSSEMILRKAEQQSLENAVREQLGSFASTRPELPRDWVEDQLFYFRK